MNHVICMSSFHNYCFIQDINFIKLNIFSSFHINKSYAQNLDSR